jgi:hypothetical protein
MRIDWGMVVEVAIYALAILAIVSVTLYFGR